MEQEKSAIFLDRDGVLTREKSYVCSARELEIFPYAADCIRQIHKKGFLAIVITNQSGIARGYFTEAELGKMNDILVMETGVDAIYYCPHYPNGIVKKYAVECRCRKPKTGLAERACKEFGIDIMHSYFVGDRASDIQLGKNMGMITVLLESGYGTARLEQKVSPDYIYRDLRDFTEML